ncbi:MAG TPA: 4a-hydroxytetrahydrobiopterin dehydratase [Solirubrobacteraceae bacterium]|jgi:4a-hydroxytetrahydrobiopterin dehydratase|nr:4a-hydroxytetrahydrobiopterin dehydratase [Solirubrobacteraceae bacterium]
MARLSEGDIDERLAGSQWRREGDAVVRDVELRGFKSAIAFVNAVAEAAEEANHHPDILLHGYRHVRLTLTTHSAGGITENDLALASTIDALAAG